MKKLSLEEILEGIEDTRRSNSVMYPLGDVLFIMLTAIICGATSYSRIEMFARNRSEWLKKYLKLENGTPIETGYLQSEMPILRCLCKMLLQLYVMIFCYRIIASVGCKYQYRLHYSSTCMRYEKICQILFE